LSARAVRATYRIETRIGAERAAAVLAGEQSTGTFVRVDGESDALRDRHGAQVRSVLPLGTVAEPSLPGAISNGAVSPGPGADGPGTPGQNGRRGEVEVARVVVDFPFENFGPSVPNILAAIAGNLFELRELAGCRLEDVQFPAEMGTRYPGPRFGVGGTRRLMQAPDGALIGGIVKPSVGLAPAEHARRVEALALAGADFCKDDELIADPPYSPLAERVEHVMRAVDRAAQRTGRKLMYAFNITGEISELRRRHDLVVAAGGTCVMVCVNIVGMSGLRYLREFSEVPIHGHRAMFGAFSRHPALGIDFRVLQKLARLAGVDHLHTIGMNNKFYETNEEVKRSIEAVREPLLGGYEILPVLSSAQWAGTVPVLYDLVPTTDVLMVAGGGIFGHPGGPREGVASLREAWDAATSGISLAERAERSEPLREALRRFA